MIIEDFEQYVLLEKGKEINPISKKYILYGAGADSIKVHKFFVDFGIAQGYEVVAFADTYKSGVEPRSGLPIISLSELNDERFLDCMIFKATSKLSFQQMLFLCEIYGVDTKRCTEWWPFGISEWVLKDDMYDELIGWKDLYLSLEDEISKMTMLSIAKCCINRNFQYLVHSQPINQYFDVFDFQENEVFYDCGAFDGQTAITFAERVNYKYKKIVCFEPDKINEAVTRRNLSEYRNIEIINSAVADIVSNQRFNSTNGGGSSISDEGEENVSCVTIDSLVFAENKDIPTFIKMDLEGGEYNALKGAEETIRKYKPKLAICVYHKADDMYQIPRLLKELNGSYKFMVRHYSTRISETVLYAN